MSEIPSELWFAIGYILVGFVGLVWGADKFVGGSAAIAKNAGISPLVVGLTIVSLGTSAPEILVSANAALSGAGDIAIGNAIGSNLANVGLVLSITILISPILIQRHLLTQELPVLLIITSCVGIFLYDNYLNQWEGWALILSLPILLIVVVIYKKNHHNAAEEEAEIPDYTTSKAIAWFVIGLVLLLICSDLLVEGAKTIATLFKVSPLIIGLTIIAVGTSLPELAASVASALKGHHDIALGNIIGSNIFNLLAVMPIPGVISTMSLDKAVFQRDYIAMLLITLTLIGFIYMSYLVRKSQKIGKIAGVFLLIGYVSYYIVLFNDFSQQ